MSQRRPDSFAMKTLVSASPALKTSPQPCQDFHRQALTDLYTGEHWLIAPAARATTISLFVASLFTGSSLAVAITSAAAATTMSVVFLGSAAVALVLALAVFPLYRAWSREHRRVV